MSVRCRCGLSWVLYEVSSNRNQYSIIKSIKGTVRANLVKLCSPMVQGSGCVDRYVPDAPDHSIWIVLWPLVGGVPTGLLKLNWICIITVNILSSSKLFSQASGASTEQYLMAGGDEYNAGALRNLSPLPSWSAPSLYVNIMWLSVQHNSDFLIDILGKLGLTGTSPQATPHLTLFLFHLSTLLLTSSLLTLLPLPYLS